MEASILLALDIDKVPDVDKMTSLKINLRKQVMIRKKYGSIKAFIDKKIEKEFGE